MKIPLVSTLFSTHISKLTIENMAKSKDLPYMSIWEKIKDFFLSSHKAEALGHLHSICHLPYDATNKNNSNDVIKIAEGHFEELKKLMPADYECSFMKEPKGVFTELTLTDPNGSLILRVVFNTVTGRYTVTGPDNIVTPFSQQEFWDRGEDTQLLRKIANVKPPQSYA
ncbi:hypothetical protein CH64_3340 [Yersinia rohdei]|uniref:Secreted effector protein sseI n=1 Tax=Yersinia rohdei TaxID=29485 RepID=A0ABN4F539_YERRO|nr:hypothetical protein [Yersinia rohdei]AJJ11753.1 hypothetical protein CH64_3340 [Yersinia rohdei]CNJ15606.1 Secreted effector protein sseI [Yersinia rohdei]